MVIHGIAFLVRAGGDWGIGTGEWRAGVWPARKGAFTLLPDRILGPAGVLNPRILSTTGPGQQAITRRKSLCSFLIHHHIPQDEYCQKEQVV